MIITRRWMLSAVMAGLLAQAAGPARAQQAAPAASPGEARIYLLRGLLGIFSLGMDSLAGKLRAKGYRPVLAGFETWSSIGDEIARARRAGDTAQIVLIGHSLGADAVVQLANRLKADKIPVDLVVTFDLTLPMVVPANVTRYVNFFQYNGFGRPAEAAPDFKGELSNVNLTADTSVSHGTIDKAAQLQALVVEKVLALTDQHLQTAASRRKNKRS